MEQALESRRLREGGPRCEIPHQRECLVDRVSVLRREGVAEPFEKRFGVAPALAKQRADAVVLLSGAGG